MLRTIQTRFILPALLLSMLHASTTSARADDKAQALLHFNQGRAAYDKNQFDEAALHFEQAYQLSPKPDVLYNLGQVNIARQRPVEAVDALTRYVDAVGNSLSRRERREVLAAIAAQNAMIGRLTISVAPAGAEVRVDAQGVSAASLHEPIRLAVGQHRIEVTLENYVANVQTVKIAAGEQLRVQIDLAPVALSPPVNNPQPAAASQPSAATLPEAASPLPAASVTSGSMHEEHSHTPPSDAQKITGFLLGGAGFVAAGVGATLALTSATQANSAMQRLESAKTGKSWDDAKSDYDAATDHNRIGWIVLGVGAAGLVAGAVMVLTASAPTARDLHVQLVPWFLPAAAGVYARSSW